MLQDSREKTRAGTKEEIPTRSYHTAQYEYHQKAERFRK